MTEDEAKTKWCPFARASLAANERADPNAALCTASACMLWREKIEPAHQENAYNRTDAPDGEGWKPGSPSKTNLHWWRPVPERREGYCGLAGQP